jgi:serine/threonine protein kinase
MHPLVDVIAHSRTTVFVDNMFLKLLPNLVDVTLLVDNINLARTKIPVPRVLDYGYSGDCSYILMEGIFDAMTLWDYMNHYQCGLPAHLYSHIDRIVADLASLGLNHNDLNPRNVLVDTDCRIKAVIDWDDCCGKQRLGEYARRFDVDPRMETVPWEWDSIYLKHSASRFDEMQIIIERTPYHRLIPKHPPLVQYPIGRRIRPC